MIPISIIVTVYNEQEFLVECLDSILGQTFREFELICVDDGSTDGSPQLLEEYAHRDSRISIITQENQGVSGARNSGFDVARGEYVLFLDADDFFEPTFFERVYAQAETDNADVVLVRFRYAREGGSLLVESPGSLRTDLLPKNMPFSATDAQHSLFRLTTPAAWNKLFRRGFLLEEGLRFDPSLVRAEDLAFTYCGLMLAKRISVVDETMINYREPSDSSVQGTIHLDPTGICRALAIVRTLASERGLLDQLERDLVNASLGQVLFSLSTIKTIDAASVLFEALRDRYLAELGILNRQEDYFYSQLDHGLLQAILNGTFEAYWFSESRRLSTTLASTSTKLTVQYERSRAAVDARDAEIERLVSKIQEFDEHREYNISVLMTQTQSLACQVRDISYEITEGQNKLSKVQAKLDAAVSSRLYKIVYWVLSLTPTSK